KEACSLAFAVAPVVGCGLMSGGCGIGGVCGRGPGRKYFCMGFNWSMAAGWPRTPGLGWAQAGEACIRGGAMRASATAARICVLVSMSNLRVRNDRVAELRHTRFLPSLFSRHAGQRAVRC